jgi:uncharacterized membrane protein
MTEPRHAPLVTAGIILGAGMGGFVDGIALHQIAQWHNMISSIRPTDTLVNAKINMFWDGVFHAGTWAMTALGVALLFRAGRDERNGWSGTVLIGSLLVGWGAFNGIEGIIDHQLLGLHHVNELSAQMLAWDLGFLVLGAAQLALGVALIKRGRATSGARPGTWRPPPLVER